MLSDIFKLFTLMITLVTGILGGVSILATPFTNKIWGLTWSQVILLAFIVSGLILVISLMIENTRLLSKINLPYLEERQTGHLKIIESLIQECINKLVVPLIEDVNKNTTPDTDGLRNHLSFNDLKKHLRGTLFWDDYTTWEIKINEYLETKYDSLKAKG